MRLSAKQQISNPEATKSDNFYLLPGICYNLQTSSLFCKIKTLDERVWALTFRVKLKVTADTFNQALQTPCVAHRVNSNIWQRTTIGMSSDRN